jgi:hypothetical protein
MYFGDRGGSQQRNALPQTRNLVLGERAPGLDGGEQKLLYGTRCFAGSDIAERRTDAAQAVRLPMRERQGIKSGFAIESRHCRLDHADAAVKLGGKAQANRCNA